MSDWHVYFVRTRSGALYAGIATDVDRRFAEHESGRLGARYLRSKGPLKLAYQARIGSRALAQSVEHRLKRLAKRRKEEIVATAPEAPELLKTLGLEAS